MAKLEEVPQENLIQLAEMCAQARARMRKQQQEVAAEAEVSPGLVSLIEASSNEAVPIQGCDRMTF